MPLYRFCLKPSRSPLYFNLAHYLTEQGWKSTRFNFRADFSEKNFQFDMPAAEQLEFKDLLAQLIHHHCSKIMPVTFCINDENWQFILNQVADQFYMNESGLFEHRTDLVWILKPAQLNNGQHIKIFQSVTDLETHFLSANRLGGNHVLQQYLMHPHLLKGPSYGHKYSIRMFLVLTNYAGAFLYTKGYFNVALNSWQPEDFTDLRSHLTNEHLKEDELNVIQVPTQQFELFKPFYPQIKSILTELIHGLKQMHPHAFSCEDNPAMAIFGFDFIVDSEEKVWLLEANHGPCFPIYTSHPLHTSLYHDFWLTFISSFVKPVAIGKYREQISCQFFEPLEF